MSNRFLFLLFGTSLVLSGCTPGHWVGREGDSLVFHLRMPRAARVCFASSADDFRLHDAVRNNGDDWQVTVDVRPGLRYFYLVDGRFYLPDCGLREGDDFGRENCLYEP